MLPESCRKIINLKLSRMERSPYKTIVLSIMAGVFISIGALAMSIAKADGCNRLVCGLIFSCGLFFVVVTGAELFTGNCMIKTLCTYEKDYDYINDMKLLAYSYIGNLCGAIIIFCLVIGTGIDVSELSKMAVAKCLLPIDQMIFRGVACNILVCLAVWLGVFLEPTNSKLERFIAIVFPITAFVACGFEHSVANMFILPFGVFSGDIDISQALIQLLFVTAGNILGGQIAGLIFATSVKEG